MDIGIIILVSAGLSWAIFFLYQFEPRVFTSIFMITKKTLPAIYYLVFYILITGVILLMLSESFFFLIIWAFMFFIIPILGWNIFKRKPKIRFSHRRYKVVYIASNLLMGFVWLSSVFLWYIHFMDSRPWPVSEYDNYVVKRDLLETGFIPKTATDIKVKDNHLKGRDGCRFVTFKYQGERIEDLKVIDNLIRARNLESMWEPPPLGSKSIKTVKLVSGSLKLPTGYRPDTSSETLRYFCDSPRKNDNFPCGHLYMYNYSRKQFWYFNYDS